MSDNRDSKCRVLAYSKCRGLASPGPRRRTFFLNLAKFLKMKGDCIPGQSAPNQLHAMPLHSFARCKDSTFLNLAKFSSLSSRRPVPGNQLQISSMQCPFIHSHDAIPLHFLGLSQIFEISEQVLPHVHLLARVISSCPSLGPTRI